MRLASVIPFALALTLAGGALPDQLRAQQPEPQPQLQARQQEAPQR